jgi:imidazolonepropionase-like amidohydrolase
VTRTQLTGGRVFDGTGAPPADAEVVVEDGRILEVGPGLDGDEAVDVGGRHLLPGLFDCHTHVTLSSVDVLGILQRPLSYRFYEAIQNLAATLAAGITTVRDAAGADAGIKPAVEDGLVQGPRLQISLTLLTLTQTGGHGDGWYPSGQEVHFWPVYPGMPDGLVDGPEAMRRKVRELVRAGADVIKAAVRAGVRSIEHGIYLDDEAIGLMLDRGTWLVPTLVAPRGVLAAAAAGAAIPAAAQRRALDVSEAHVDSSAGPWPPGQGGHGTDSGVTPHGRNPAELELMAKGGMAPAEVLAATTSSAAELLGWPASSAPWSRGSGPTWWWSTATRSSWPPCPSASPPWSRAAVWSPATSGR